MNRNLGHVKVSVYLTPEVLERVDRSTKRKGYWGQNSRSTVIERILRRNFKMEKHTRGTYYRRNQPSPLLTKKE